VHALLELANVSARDRLYDLGSGDGRIILAAAQDFQAASVGLEWDQALCDKVTSAIKTLGLQDRVAVIQGDIFDQDLRPATVITGYLLPKSWERLAPILRQQLKPGTRVVTVNHPIPGWQTVATKHRRRVIHLSWDLCLYRTGP
jgi:16S rRNA A1518/A1519 N6-dimethyltransferase RsmA/KsgA/DIM1 with predicted DNA glycosylase/AP lyase activity